MYRQNILLLFAIFFTTALILCSYTEKAFACPCGGSFGKPSSSALGSSATNGISAIHNFHTIRQPMPPGFPYKWINKDLIEQFSEDGLEIEKAKPVAEVDYGKIPAKVKEITKFSIPSFGEDKVGYIFSFEKKKNLEKVKKHYLELNKKGELYTWSFVKDNVLLLLSGTISEDKARQYESVLYDLK
jgi:hypothetical protein